MSDSNVQLEDYYKELMPRYYCGRCNVTLFGDEKRCPDCGSKRPPSGFPPLELAFDPWLGHFIAERFFVNKRVGRGSSGSVYRVQALPFGREFAIKIIDLANLPKDSSLTTIEQRINREIRALDELDSPHIVQLYEVLELPDSVVGIVMEYVRGITLDVFVSAFGRLPIRLALELMLQIASGVIEAHNAHMIHRDLKPENILVETLGPNNYYVHILDFGLVRMDDGLHLTQGFLGSPLYASPEQALAGAIDHRSDIYSLGGILFFILTGSPPLNFDSIFQILQAHVNGEVPTLEEQCYASFPQGLENLVSSMLARDPLDRPPNVETVVERIHEILAQLEGTKNPSSDAELLEQGVPIILDLPEQPLQEKEQEIDDTTLPVVKKEDLVEKTDRLQRDSSAEFLSSIPSFTEPGQKPQSNARRTGRDGKLPRIEYPRNLDDPFDHNNDTDPAMMFGEKLNTSNNGMKGELNLLEEPSASTVARIPWQDQNVIVLAREANLRNPRLLSATGNGQSIAFLTRDEKIQEIRWAGRLSRSPGIKLSAHTRLQSQSLTISSDEITTFFNLESAYIIGTKRGVILRVTKDRDSDYVEIFRHPTQSAVREVSAVETGLVNFIAIFENNDVYFAYDVKGLPKQSSWIPLKINRPIIHAAMAQNGDSFATIEEGQRFSLYLTNTPSNPEVTTEISSPVKQLAYLQDGHVIALFRDDSVIELRHAISGTKLTTLYDPNEIVQYVVFGADGAFLGFYVEEEVLYAVDLQREVIRST